MQLKEAEILNPKFSNPNDYVVFLFSNLGIYFTINIGIRETIAGDNIHL